MPGGDQVGAQAHRMIEKGLELDLGIAQHIGIRRAAGLVLAQEFGEHAVPVFGGEVHRLQFDADHFSGGCRIQEVLTRRAVGIVVVILPVLHEQAQDIEPGLSQHPCRDRGIDPSGHPDHHPPASAQAVLPVEGRVQRHGVSDSICCNARALIVG